MQVKSLPSAQKNEYVPSPTPHNHIESSLVSWSQRNLSFSSTCALQTKSNFPSWGGRGFLISPCVSWGHILGSQHLKEDNLGNVTVKGSVTSLRSSTQQSSCPPPSIWTTTRQGATRSSLQGAAPLKFLLHQAKKQ